MVCANNIEKTTKKIQNKTFYIGGEER